MYGNLYTTPAQYNPNILKSLFSKSNKNQNNSLNINTNNVESKYSEPAKSELPQSSFNLCMCIKSPKVEHVKHNMQTSDIPNHAGTETALMGCNDYDISAQHYMP